MVSLDDGPTAGTAGAAGAAITIGSSTGITTGVAGAGAGCTGAAGATVTWNSADAMGDTADNCPALPADATCDATSAGTDNVVASTGADSAVAPGSIGTSADTAAMVGTTKAGTSRTTGTASQ